VAEVRQIAPHPDGRFDLATVGTERFRLLRVDDSLPYFRGEVEMLPEEELPDEELPDEELPGGPAAPSAGDALAFTTRRVQAGFRAYLNALSDRGGGVVNVADLPDEPLLLSYVVGAAMIIDLGERQSLLAAPTALDRLRLERSLLVREDAMLRATTSRPAPDFAFEPFSQNLRRPRVPGSTPALVAGRAVNRAASGARGPSGRTRRSAWSWSGATAGSTWRRTR
jgi:uncharacterized protein